MSPINLIDFGSFFDIFLDYQFDVFVLQLVTFVDIINVKNDCINLIVPNLFRSFSPSAPGPFWECILGRFLGSSHTSWKGMTGALEH